MAHYMQSDDHLHLDWETRSKVDLTEVGTVRYAKHPSTKALMLAWALNEEPVQQWFPMTQPMPPRLKRLLNDPKIKCAAHNYRFERNIFRYRLGIDIPIRRWVDTMVMAYRLSLPGKLETLGDVINIEDAKKDKRGDRLIHLFCEPRTKAQRKKNPEWIFNDETTHPVEWNELCEYNRQDVVAERKIFNILRKFYVPSIEDDIWYLDEETNDHGMPIDLEFVRCAVAMVDRVHGRYMGRMRELTGLDNPNSGAQLLPWLIEHGYPFQNLKKASVEAANKDFDLGIAANEVIKLRLAVSKTSVDKYRQMLDIEDEGRLRYCFQYGGAQRTLRWAGRKPQLQNLPSRFDDVWVDNLDEVRQLILDGNEDWIEIMYGDPLDALSACVRTAIVAPEGKIIVCADLSSIESRGVANLAKCKKMIEVFESGKDMYKVFASGLFKIPYDAVTKHQRTFCKPPVLGSGFGLGAGEVRGEYPLEERTGLVRYAHDMGISMTVEETTKTTKFFREQYVEVPNCWYALENAAVKAIQTKKRQRVMAKHPVTGEYDSFPLDVWFDMVGPFLRMELPSGRFLYYLRPKLTSVTRKSKFGNSYTKHEISYEGFNLKKKWTRIKTYGGKFIENLVQAWARDIMALGMLRAAKRGFILLGSVHDELITLVKKQFGERAVKILCDMLTAEATDYVEGWNIGIPLKAAGFCSPYYRK